MSIDIRSSDLARNTQKHVLRVIECVLRDVPKSPCSESGTRVLHVLEGDGEHDKAAVRRLSKALSWLVAKLEHDGALTADDIGELLLHSVL